MFAEFRARWEQRHAEWSRLGIMVDGGKLAAEVLDGLAAVEREMQLGSVTLKEANLIGGYSIDRLQHLVASGELENIGRKHRPRIRRVDVPIKAGHRLPNEGDQDQLSERRRIAASFVTGENPT